MSTQLPALTELNTTSDNDLLLVREASTGVDKKMRAVNLRAKATTKADVGLGNADNTSDANKPISTATQTALDAKVTGPASATNNHLPLFDGTTGKLIKGAGKGVPAGAIVGTTDTQTLTNKTLTSPAISGGTVNNASIGATTPNTGAFTTLTASSTVTLNGTTIPASATLVTTAATQTLTNKTLTTPIINTSITGTAVTQTDTDTTANRLLKVGDFGLGRGNLQILLDSQSFNDLRKGPFDLKRFTSEPNDGPGYGFGGVAHFPWSADGDGPGLQIAFGTSSTAPRLNFRNLSSTGQTPWFSFYHTGNISTIDATTNQIFRVDNNERMRITSAGNVGIGTTTPGSALQVQGLITGTAVTQSATDTTAGRLTKVGDFGLGLTGTQAPPIISNFLDDISPGYYQNRIDLIANRPSTETASWLASVHVSARDSGGRTFYLTVFSGASPRHWVGTKATSASTEILWRQLYHTGNILGTVSQSAGVPTGEVMQRGSNANGEFVRFADGTQICTHIITDGRTASGSHDWTWTFPIAFINSNSISSVVTLSAVPENLSSPSQNSTTTTAVTFRASRTDAGAASWRVAQIGRWF